ncbi:unnamed protein product [Rotaria socialis]|uniref:G-protein coupled receptors family 1 profile domain-containing protein n=1 Tax=Rotaria socialis TaxID=392032 RepID=A0A818RV42_9BILA|nr:unnamed protein product [Rotaria socialis]CAF4564201.1 unnamed protein product [Rotaria socialis]
MISSSNSLKLQKYNDMNITEAISYFWLPSQHDSAMDNVFEQFINSSTAKSLNYSSIHRIVIRFFSLYALALVIIGTLGNLITIIILCRPSLRRYVTMRYLVAVSVCDIISLYGWNLNNFYKFSISSRRTNLEEISLVHCRVVSYLTFVGLQLSSWHLAAVSLDRCCSLYFLTWKQTYGKLSRTKYHIGILAIVCLLLNSHILFLNGYRDGPPHYKVECYKRRTNPFYIFPQWERIHLILYNLCPFSIMLLCNIYIIFVTVRSARIRTSIPAPSSRKCSRPSIARHRQLSLMLILITFVFVLLTLPSCIYFVFFRHRMSPKKYSRNHRHMIQICLSSIQFTSHAINFFLYCFSGTNFRTELHDFTSELCLSRLSALKFKKTTTATCRINRNKQNYESNMTLDYQKTEFSNSLKEMKVKFKQQKIKDNPDGNERITLSNAV